MYHLEVIINLEKKGVVKMTFKKCKIFLIVCLLGVLCTSNIEAVNRTPVFGGRYQNGVGRLIYYIDYPSGTGFYEYLIINSVNNWLHTGKGDNPIEMIAVSSKQGSNMDFYTAKASHWGGDKNVLGETYFYNNSGTEINPTSNWSYTEIYINDDSNRNRYYTEVQGTITHEMGHAFGLKHYNENPYSIMAQTWARKVQVVQQCDNDAINYLY